MIKAVLDTNVFISALFWKGSPYQVLKNGIEGEFIIVSSSEILAEVRERLLNKRVIVSLCDKTDLKQNKNLSSVAS